MIGALVFVLQPIAPRVCWLAPLLWSTMRSMKNTKMSRICANSTPLQAKSYVRYAAGDSADYLFVLHQNGIQRVIVFGDFVPLTRDLSDIVSSNGFSASAVEQSQVATSPLGSGLRDVTKRYGDLYSSKYTFFATIHDGCRLTRTKSRIRMTSGTCRFRTHRDLPCHTRCTMDVRYMLRSYRFGQFICFSCNFISS